MLQQAGFKTSPMTQVLLPNGHEVVDTEPVLEVKSPRSSSHQQRPASMYETREGYQHRVHWDKSQMRDTSEYESPTSTLRQGVTQSMYQCPTQTSTGKTNWIQIGLVYTYKKKVFSLSLTLINIFLLLLCASSW